MHYSSEGYWGKGIYFAGSASHSHAYANKYKEGKRGMFLAKINVGKEIFIPYDEKNKKMTSPPDDHDSVKGHTNNSDVWIVYKNKKAYPEFYITYQELKKEKED